MYFKILIKGRSILLIMDNTLIHINKPQGDSAHQRRLLCSVIIDANQYLYLPNTCAAMATTYLHNYMKFHNKITLDSKEQGIYLTAFIYLSCKVSENHRSIRDIYNVVSIINDADISLGELDKSYTRTKPSIIDAEHQMLRIMKFQVEIDLPHKYILNISRYLRLSQNPVHICWSLLNDSLYCSEFPLTDSHVIALGCLLVSLNICKELDLIITAVGDPKIFDGKWYAEFNVPEDKLLSTSQWLLESWKRI